MGVHLFPVQAIGRIVLHEGDIAEMKTGEGKTFVASQPLYLNALTGNNVHLVTVNDYLAKRDANWVAPVYEKLGMRSAFIENMMAPRGPRRRLRGRDHVRDELRVRLRLPPRQHGRLSRRDGAARPLLRDRGRGRLDPDRRGQDASDHLGRARGRRAGLLRLRARRPADGRGPYKAPSKIDRGEVEPDVDYTFDEKFKTARRSRAESRRSSARSRSTTCTTPATSSSSTT